MVCQSDWLHMMMSTDFTSRAKPYSCAKEALDYRCDRLNGKALARSDEVHSLIKVAVSPASGALRALDGRQGSGAKPFRIAFAFCGERNDPACGQVPFSRAGRDALSRAKSHPQAFSGTLAITAPPS